MGGAAPAAPPAPLPRVGVGVFIFDPAGRVLLVQRGRSPAAGLWSVPGGRVEWGETLHDACRREVREETGLDVRPGPLVTWFERIEQSHHYVVLDFLAVLEAASAAPVAGDDAQAARWVAARELRALAVTPELPRYVALARTRWRRWSQASTRLPGSPGTSRTRRGTR